MTLWRNAAFFDDTTMITDLILSFLLSSFSLLCLWKLWSNNEPVLGCYKKRCNFHRNAGKVHFSWKFRWDLPTRPITNRGDRKYATRIDAASIFFRYSTLSVHTTFLEGSVISFDGNWNEKQTIADKTMTKTETQNYATEIDTFNCKSTLKTTERDAFVLYLVAILER